MKKSTVFLMLTVMILLSACSNDSGIMLRTTNTLDQDRAAATLLINRSEISQWCEIPDSALPVLKGLDGRYIPCQVDDVNGDGDWDELFGLVSMKAKEQKTIGIHFVNPADYPEFTQRSGIHLGAAREDYRELDEAPRLEGVAYHNYNEYTSAAYQMEGPAWENDKVGFRNYLDQRNGMDIFGKTSSEIVLPEVGKAGGPSYHESDEWGMDILKVGTSLGAGAIAYMYKDSLYRVGDNGSGTFKKVFEGSQRSRFILDYTGWKLDELSLDVEHQIEIAGGRHYYSNLVTYSGTEDRLKLAVGIVNMHSKEMHVLDLDENYSALVTHDAQAEDGSVLAMALMVPKVYLSDIAEAPAKGPGITACYYTLLDCRQGEAINYRFYSLWAKEDNRWSSMEEVTRYLEEEAQRWTRSLAYGSI